MKKFISTLALLGFFTAISAMQVSLDPKDKKPSSCKEIMRFKQQSIASATSKEIVKQAAIEEAKEAGANRVDIKFSTVKHPKLGKRYYATAVASVCK